MYHLFYCPFTFGSTQDAVALAKDALICSHPFLHIVNRQIAQLSCMLGAVRIRSKARRLSAGRPRVAAARRLLRHRLPEHRPQRRHHMQGYAGNTTAPATHTSNRLDGIEKGIWCSSYSRMAQVDAMLTLPVRGGRRWCVRSGRDACCQQRTAGAVVPGHCN